MAMRIAATALGIYAGLLGAQHGIFEILQGNVATQGVMINAIGPPCQAETVWHACLPAMTLVPNLRLSGILASIVGLSIAIWAGAFVHKKRGGLVLMLLSFAMLLVGGGFVPTYIGFVAGIVGTGIQAPLTRRKARRPSQGLTFLARLWPWPLVMLVAWFPGAWLAGHYFNQILLKLGFILFFLFDLGLPLLTALSGWAYDVHNQTHAN